MGDGKIDANVKLKKKCKYIICCAAAAEPLLKKMSQKISTPIIAVVFFILCLSVLVIQKVSYAEEGKFGGLGLVIVQMFDPDAENKMGSLVVLGVLEGKPASKSGIQGGDVITHINGTPTKGNKFEDLMSSTN